MKFKNLFQKLLPSRRDNKFDFFDPADHDGLLDENLQSAIEAVTQDASEENRRHLYEVLLKATFCLPASNSEGDSAQVSAVQNEAGEIALVAFSDPPALGRWTGKPESMMVMPGQKLFDFVVENGFAEVQINPAGPVGGRIPQSECALLAQGKIPV